MGRAAKPISFPWIRAQRWVSLLLLIASGPAMRDAQRKISKAYRFSAWDYCAYRRWGLASKEP